MKGPDLLVRVARGEIVLGDGAWGTELMTRGLEAGEPAESLVLRRPDVVLGLGREYVAAGADFLTTVTFGATRPALSSHGLAGQAGEVVRAAVEVARRASGGRAAVAGSIGPTGGLLAPYGDLSPEDARSAYTELARALVQAGVDFLLVETMSDLREALIALAAAREAGPDLPVVVTLTYEETPRGPFTIMGDPVSAATRALEEAGADVTGANCGNGTREMASVTREMLRHARCPVAVQPNAGRPHGRSAADLETPAVFAERVGAMARLGARIVGGCCGAGPAHMAALRRALVRAPVVAG